MKNNSGKWYLLGALAAFVLGCCFLISATGLGMILWVVALVLVICGIVELTRGCGKYSPKKMIERMTDEAEKSRIQSAIESGRATYYKNLNVVLTDREAIIGGKEGGIVPFTEIVNAYSTNMHTISYSCQYKWIKVLAKDGKVYYGAWMQRKNNADFDAIVDRLKKAASGNQIEGGIE